MEKNDRKEWKWNKNLSNLFFGCLRKKKKKNWMKIENYHYCLSGSWMKKNKNESFMTTFLLCIYGGREITSTLVHWCDWVAFGQKHLDSWMMLDEE